MSDKILTWLGNALMAMVLVILSSQHFALAQEGSVESGTDAQVSVPNGGAEPGKVVIPLSATATARTVSGLEVSPSNFDLGVVEIGESKQQKVMLSHVGDIASDPIVIKEALLFGQNADEFQVDFNGFLTLFPGDSTEFNVLLTPSLPGTKSAGLRLAIEGATSPHVLLFNGWSRYPLTSDLGVSDQLLKFGQVIEGAIGKKNFLLTNLGDTDAPAINITAINLGGDTPAAFSTDFQPVLLEPGETVDVNVTLQDNNEGFKSSDVEIEHDGNNGTLDTRFQGTVVKPQSIPVNFEQSLLNNATLTRATSIQFGPDGNLYVAEMAGLIQIYSVVRNGKNNYTATKIDTISSIQGTTNHDDDGTVNGAVKTRLLTGIFVTGSANAPVIYAASSDPRQAAGPSGLDANLDTNSGILHRLTKNGTGWNKEDLVRGLPRSEENHVSNGLLMYNNKLLLASGGHTNQGLPSNNFAELSEYALSAAVLEIDINAINGTYDIPTLDDEDRPGVNDANDPFGGNDGKNQAMLVNNGPVQIFATGFRNIFDITLTQSGKLYTFDNGPNPGWGGTPGGNCLNNIDNSGDHRWDGLHLFGKGYYGGHPNPTRGNKNNTFNDSNPQSPIEGPANPEECEYLDPGDGDGALTTIKSSSNGLDEYTASNFGNGMQGDLLVASFDKSIYRLALNNAGNKVTSKSQLITGLGTVPLDLTAQGDGDIFPGTIWIVDNLENGITVLEPSDY